MRDQKWNEAGLSLTELIITLVISGVLFVTMAMIIIYANQSWLKATTATQSLQGSRVAKKTMEYQIRGAITVPAAFGAPTYLPVVMSSQPFTISADKSSVVFHVIDRGSKAFKLDRFRFENNQLYYDYWYAYTDGGNGNMSYNKNPMNSMVILQDVQSMEVTPANNNHPTTDLQVKIVQAKNLFPGDTVQMLISTTTFNIKTRNFGVKQ